MKKYISFLLSMLLILSACPVPVQAVEESPEFSFELSVEGSDTKVVYPGEIITVTLHLLRTDKDEAYSMYAMQDEIRYDSKFFELVEGSAVLSQGIQSTDISVLGGYREFYMNYLSFSGGKQWSVKTRVGSFQLKVIGTSGVSTITNEDYLVSFKDGSDSYPCEANTLTVILTTDCTIRFETNGGSKVDSITAIYGEKLTKPADPVRDGKRFVGWYKDIHLTEAWDFTSDTVTGNLTLYAKWENVPSDPTVPTPTDPPHTHTWQDATCTTPKTCSKCQATEGKPLGHRETTIPAVAPTCTEVGRTEGKSCSVCKETLVAQKLIPALGHSYKTKDNVHYTCEICGDIFSIEIKDIVEEVKSQEEAGKLTEEDVQEAVSKVQKMETEHLEKAMEADDQNSGVITHISELESFVDIDVVVTVNNQMDHVFPENHVAIIGAKLNEVIDNTQDIVLDIKEPEGSTDLEIPDHYDEEKTVQFSMKLHNIQDSHELDVPVKIFLPIPEQINLERVIVLHYASNGSIQDVIIPDVTERNGVAYAGFVVDGFSNFAVSEIHEHSYEAIKTAPTCTDRGYTVYLCSCQDSYVTDIVDALGHNEVKHAGKAATCTVKGWEPYVTCSRCDYSTYKEIAPVGHMETKLTAVAPTCTEAGLTSGVKCLACDIIIQKQEIIPATGHKFEDGACVICGAEDPNQTKPTEPKPTEPKPTEPKPTEPKPTEPKPTEPKPTEPKPTEPTEPNVPEDAAVKRVYGENRYETSLKVAEELRKSLGVDKFDTVIVASGTSFADALSGSALAIQKNAPILVTNPFNEAKIQDYITKTLKPNGAVYILGGENAVPGSFEKGLAGSSFTIKRLAGEDRYETNLKILLEIGVEAGDEVLVCTGKTFADSLSASATGMPILLVRGDYKLFYNQMLFLNARGTSNRFIIIGGENAVSSKLEAELKSYGTIQRIGGENRFETSVLLAERFFENPDSAVLAYARKFPDGLCGGPLAYRMQAPLILTQTGREEQADAYAETNKITEGYVLGGDGLISDGSAMKIFNTSKVVVVK